MKISKITNRIIISLILPLFAVCIIACTDKKSTESITEPAVEEPQKVELPPVEEVQPVVEEAQPVEAEPEPVVTPEPVVEEPAPEVTKEPEVKEEKKDDEYSRSVGNVAVDRNTFENDKEKVLQIIKKLDRVMKDLDYKTWISYVDNESIQYWKTPSNLKKAQKRLPVKGLRLNNLQDYFKYVFVPARKGREVTEIRYISDTYVKVIQVQEEQDIVYYYFNKIDGNWMVHLPPIDN